MNIMKLFTFSTSNSKNIRSVRKSMTIKSHSSEKVTQSLFFRDLYLFNNLEYEIRFGCSNEVGFSPWGNFLQITLPKPGPPDKTMVYVDNVDVITMDTIIILDNFTVELSWEAAEDNGAAVNFYQLAYVKVQ